MSKKLCLACSRPQTLGSFWQSNHADDGRFPVCAICIRDNPELGHADCRSCGKRRKLTKFPGHDRAQPCSYCTASYDNSIVPVLKMAKLYERGHSTVSELLFALGVPSPTKSQLNGAAAWLRANGYRCVRWKGRPGFRVSITNKPGRTDTPFALFERRHPDVSASLGLSEAEAAGLRSASSIPVWMRYAMSAYVAGLPPYSE